jgi:hypothetical protein
MALFVAKYKLSCDLSARASSLRPASGRSWDTAGPEDEGICVKIRALGEVFVFDVRCAISELTWGSAENCPNARERRKA